MKYSGLSILVVEDDPTQRYVICKTLQVSGVEHIHTCEDVDVVKKTLECVKMDGTFVDLVLEKCSGFDVAKECTSRNTPVVFVTAADDPHNMAKMYDYGWVIRKPISVAAIERALEHFANIKK